ncbi:cupin domain-containing protein [Qingshengfaniella alkalisoli]|uniref:Cupin domain-containing protein n=1 Tax=Qingshengfaniella alkalisoli TaxID=2599296 RepID=A0A5B8IAS3_9RHOB|nr:cupin domain-containing protein [Qingshengfaniella alkalisoli]QDY71655.1 cupin domain-containing protein [Qingshengfaniella alkalisoli]
MTKTPKRIPRSEWSTSDLSWKGTVNGTTLGADVTILFYATGVVGVGPRWHVHDYDEVFIVREGRALFTIGDQKIEAEAGDVLLGPASVPHKFVNLGPGRLETTDIHLSDERRQTDLPDPELEG